MNEPLGVLLVDDDPLVLRFLRDCFSKSGKFQVLGSASSGQEALSLAERTTPDAVLIDVNMPGMGGVECLDELSRISPTSAVLLITSVADPEILKKAVMAGCQGFIYKDTEPSAIVEATLAATQGLVVLSQSPWEGQGQRSKASLPEFSQRETEVLRLLHAGLSTRSIARDLSLSESSIKLVVSKIAQKLGVRSRLEIVSHTRDLNFQE